LRFTTEIHLLETQGRKTNNETVTQFLLQYLNDKQLVSKVVSTQTNDIEEINQIYFEPPIRTNYLRITPISFRNSIAMRFEIYSRGNIHNKEFDHETK
jgi:hypothetical protein